MRYEILLFAQLREAIGNDRLTIELPERATVADALNALSERHDVISSMRGRLAIAVNQKYQNASTLLREGDVIALIPPVSGG